MEFGGTPPEFSEDDIKNLFFESLQQACAQMPAQELLLVFQIAVSEMFIRSGNDDQWQAMWDQQSENVRMMFDRAETPFREVYEDYARERDALERERLQRLEQPHDTGSWAEMSTGSGLEELFETYGVLEEKPPRDEGGYGQYL